MSGGRWRWVGWSVGAVIVLSLLGAGQLAGLFLVPVGLAFVLVWAVRGGRPRRGQQGLRARRVGFFARYRPIDEAEGLPAVVLAAFAAHAVAKPFALDGTPSAFAVAVLVPGVLYAVAPQVVAALLALGGALAATYEVLAPDADCATPLVGGGRALYLVTLGLFAVVFTVVRSGIWPLSRPLGFRVRPAVAALLVFGVVELAAFVVRPGGLDVFQGAPAWAPPVALACLLVVFAYASVAPQVTLALVAVAVAAAEVSLAVAAIGADTTGGAGCDREPWFLLAYPPAFVVVVLFVLSLRPGRPIGPL